MKKIIILSALAFAGCSSTQTPLKTESVQIKSAVLVTNYKRPEELDQQEVIQLIKQCQDSRMKPVVQYVFQTTEFGKLKTPYTVHCEPYRLER